MLEPIVFKLDPDWTYFQRYSCGHVQHACCREHLDAICELCGDLDKAAASQTS